MHLTGRPFVFQEAQLERNTMSTQNHVCNTKALLSMICSTPGTRAKISSNKDAGEKALMHGHDVLQIIRSALFVSRECLQVRTPTMTCDCVIGPLIEYTANVLVMRASRRRRASVGSWLRTR